MSVRDLTTDLHDGLVLINLLEIITNKSFPRYFKNPKIAAQKLDNISEAFKFMEKNFNMQLIGCNANGLLL